MLNLNLGIFDAIGLSGKIDLTDAVILHYLYDNSRELLGNYTERFTFIDEETLIDYCGYVDISEGRELRFRLNRLSSLGLVSIRESGSAAGKQEVKLNKDFYDTWESKTIKGGNRTARLPVGLCGNFAEILKNDKGMTACLKLIEKYFESYYELSKTDELLMFLDVCKGIVANEITEVGLQFAQSSVSVYDPKSIKMLKELIPMVSGSIEVVAVVLDELNLRLNENNLRNLLIEYVHACSAFYISRGQSKITISLLRSEDALAAFTAHVLEYGNTQTAHYFVENVIAM